MAEKKKLLEYATVRSALILGVCGIIVAAMNICNSRSQLVTDNRAHVETIKSKDATIEGLKQQLSSKDAEIQHLETELTPFKTVLTWANYTGSEQEKLKQLADEIRELKDPLKKLIASATSHVEVTIKSDEQVSTDYADHGGYLVFLKDRQPLLVTAGTESTARQNGKGEVTYGGDFSIEPKQPGLGKPIEELQASNSIEMMFLMIPANSQILRGSASVVINGNTRLEFVIPPQQMQDDRFFIQDVKQGFVMAR